VWHNDSLMRGLGGFISAAAIGWVVLGSLALGCGGHEASGTTCSNDGDCGAGERCQRSGTPGESPQIRTPLCSFQPCTAASDCGTGMVCGPPPPDQRSRVGNSCGPLGCTAPCTEGSCGDGWTCLDTGICQIVTCDQPGGVVCPEHWSCEPDADRALQNATVKGSGLADPPGTYYLVLAGCARRTCAYEDGYGCADFYVCDPDTATDASGCAPVPCTTTGHCVGDGWICESTSSSVRPPGIDPFGCVVENCEDGVDCSYVDLRPGAGYCNPSAPKADDYGCAIHSCADGDYCYANETCKPGEPGTDGTFCVPKDAGSGGKGGAASGTGGAIIALGGTGDATGGPSDSGGTGGATGGTGQNFGPGRCVSR